MKYMFLYYCVMADDEATTAVSGLRSWTVANDIGGSRRPASANHASRQRALLTNAPRSGRPLNRARGGRRRRPPPLSGRGAQSPRRP
jgi:hypothetical protein